MRPPVVVELDPLANSGPGLCSPAPCMQVDAFVFEGTPQPFHEDVVEEAALAIHRDFHTGFPQPVGPRP